MFFNIFIFLNNNYIFLLYHKQKPPQLKDGLINGSFGAK